MMEGWKGGKLESWKLGILTYQVLMARGQQNLLGLTTLITDGILEIGILEYWNIEILVISW